MCLFFICLFLSYLLSISPSFSLETKELSKSLNNLIFQFFSIINYQNKLIRFLVLLFTVYLLFIYSDNKENNDNNKIDKMKFIQSSFAILPIVFLVLVRYSKAFEEDPGRIPTKCESRYFFRNFQKNR